MENRHPKFGVKFLDPEAKKFGLPKFRYRGDAGVDIHVVLAPEDREHGKTIFPGQREWLDSGLALAAHDGYWVRVVHRSSTEKRLRLRVIEGTIDSGFTGQIRAQVANENSFPVIVQHGDRVAQLIAGPLVQPDYFEVEQLPETDRSANGFGSTGRG